MTTTKKLTPETPADQIPAMLITPTDWAMENQRLAAEYAGLPEGKVFLSNSRRFMVIAARLAELLKQSDEMTAELAGLRAQLEQAADTLESALPEVAKDRPWKEHAWGQRSPGVK